MARARSGRLARRLAAAVRTLCLLALVISGLGTHEAARSAAEHVDDSAMAGHHGGPGLPHGEHHGHSKFANACCLAGPCKVALPWRPDAVLGGRTIACIEDRRAAALIEATPPAPWRPPA